MKRAPLQRKTPLRRVAMSPRRTPLKRSTKRLGLRRPQTSVERHARAIVVARSGGWCEARGDGPATEWHHRIRRSQGGQWSPANGLHVCPPCHQWITDNPRGARAKGWGLWRSEIPAEEPVCRRGAWVWLTEDGSVEPASDIPVVLHDFPIGGAR